MSREVWEWSDLRMPDVSRYIESGGLVSRTTAMREIFVNIIESGATLASFFAYNVNGVLKTCVEDNGCGIYPENMKKYLGEFGNSGTNKHDSQNFGQGVRKANLSRNRVGITWKSIRDGQTSYLLLQQKPKWKVGFRKESKLNRVKTHGTSIVFLGNDAKEDTTQQFGTPASMAAYLRNRFFDLPRTIDANIYGTPAKITGLKATLDKLAIDSGTTDLPDGLKLHYYILRDDSNYAGVYAALRESSGMCEIYEPREARELHKYGLDASYRRVVLVIEALASTTKKPTLTTGTLDRTTLIHDNVQVTELLNDDKAWPKMLRDNMPEAIKKFEKEELTRRIDPEVRSALKNYNALLKLYDIHLGEPKKKRKSPRDTDGGDDDPVLKKLRNFVPISKSVKGKNRRKGFVIPKFLPDSALDSVLAYNPKSNTLFYNFEHPLTKGHMKQFLSPYGSGESRVCATAALIDVWKWRAIEAVLTMREAKYTDEQITPEVLTTALLLKSTSFGEAGKRLSKVKKAAV